MQPDVTLTVTAKVFTVEGARSLVAAGISCNIGHNRGADREKCCRFGGMLTTVTPLQLSFAVTEKTTLLRLHWPGSASTTMLAGQLMVGACVSWTMTRC